ncbi:MAG: hypothetical protein AABY90_10315, partial [Nitrospirota bacterium]
EQRRHLIKRWLQWCNQHRLKPTDESAVLFILAIPRLAPQGQLAYAKQMAGTFRRMAWPRDQLLAVASALAADGAAVPVTQAQPLNKEALRRWLETVHDERVRASAMVAWKTASRWGDILGLHRSNFISVQPEEVIVAWGTSPKGWRSNPYHPSMYTVIEGEWTSEICDAVTRLPEGQPLCPWSTATLDWQLKRNPVMSEFSGHSFKKGAASHIVEVVTRDGA